MTLAQKSSSTAAFAQQAATSYSAELHRFLARKMCRREEIEDIVQEVYIRLLKIENGEFVRNPRAYIFQTAHHVMHDFREKATRGKQFVVVDSEIVEQVSENPSHLQPDQIARRLATQEELKRAFAKMPGLHQAVLLLYGRDGYSYKEIAQRLNISPDQVERYLAAGKQVLADHLGIARIKASSKTQQSRFKAEHGSWE